MHLPTGNIILPQLVLCMLDPLAACATCSYKSSPWHLVCLHVLHNTQTGVRTAGMAALLDHTERGNAAAQPLALSIIADFLELSPLAHDCFRDWLSEHSLLTAPQLLLRLWREAEAETSICTDGVLTSLHRPLAGTGKRALWLPPHEVRCNA